MWFQFACISWIWTTIITEFMQVSVNIVEKTFLSLIGFVLSSHNFPIMAWATIDGLFLSSIGLFLCSRESRPRKSGGNVLVGASYLCKQNFAALAVASLVALGDWAPALGGPWLEWERHEILGEKFLRHHCQASLRPRAPRTNHTGIATIRYRIIEARIA